MIFYWVMVLLGIVIPMLILFYSLPTEIRNVVSGILGGILSLIVIPLALNHINKRKENAFKLFGENKRLYLELSNIFIALLITNDDEFQDQRDILKKFICVNYSTMCISFSSSLTWDVVYIYNECGHTNSEDNIKYYIQKCLREIRKQEGIKKGFYLNNMVLKMIAEQSKENICAKSMGSPIYLAKGE